MISMVRLRLRKEWEVVIGMTHSTSSNLSLVEEAGPFGGGGSSRGRRQRRGEDVVHHLKVSLEDLYSGTTKKLSLSRNVICSKCNGKGSKSQGNSMLRDYLPLQPME